MRSSETDRVQTKKGGSKCSCLGRQRSKQTADNCNVYFAANDNMRCAIAARFIYLLKEFVVNSSGARIIFLSNRM